MRSLTMFRVALVVLLLAVPGFGWAQAALIVHSGTAGYEADALAHLTTRLLGHGYAVTASVGLPGGDNSGFGQIWDIRYNNTTPLSAADITAYVSYMAGGGSLFVMGENTAYFATRNNSLIGLVQAAGGGTITLTTPNNVQTVAPPFTGPTAVSSVTYVAAAGAAFPGSTGSGRLITADATNVGAAIVWGPGQMSAARAGALIAVFDVNFLQAGAAAPLQALTDNIISYLAAPGTAVIVHSGSGGPEADALANLTTHLNARGFVVTAGVGLPGGGISGVGQVWDIRYNNTTPLSAGDITAYVNYMAGGGSLFVMGENSAYMTRDNSLVSLVQAAGGGTITLTTPNNVQTVAPPFTGPSAVSSVTYQAASGAAFPSGTGSGSLITADATGVGAAIVWGPGRMSAARAGALIAVFDVNFLQAGAAAPLQALTDNMISYLAAPRTALIVHDGVAGIEADALAHLTTHLTARGFAVTASVGLPAGSIFAFGQVWDIRYNNTTPLSAGDITAYVSYMAAGGSLFVVGEHAGFATRNSSLIGLVQAAGGGTITLTAPNNLQTVAPPFTGPTAVSSVTYQAAGGAAFPGGTGSGALITADATNVGAAIVWAPGRMRAAHAGALIAVFDVNFLQAAAAAPLQALTDNMISYLAAPRTALIVHSGAAGNEADALTSLTTRLTARGFAVMTTVGLPGSSHLAFGQIWDVRYNNTTPVSAGDITAYVNYMAGGGSLFAVGENTTNFVTRNNSLVSLVQAAGGGTITLTAPSSVQTVAPPFTGPSAVSSVTYLAAGGAAFPSGTGRGRLITADATNVGSAIVWAPGRMSAARAGALVVVFDVNFLQAGAAAPLQALSDNIISYLAAPVSFDGPDFNGDGKPDLVWRNGVTGQNVVWFMDGSTLLGQALLPEVADQQWQMVAVADFNSDGKPDLVWRNVWTGQNVVFFLNGATFVSQALLPAVSDTAWQVAAAADFNGDGKPDLLWRHQTTGLNVVWYLDGVAFVSQALLPAVSDTAWQVAAAADFNGDGRPDLLWRNRTTGSNVVWVMNGVTFVSQALLPAVSDPGWRVGQVADMNGDGQADILWRNQTTGQNVVWAMNGVTFVSQALLPPVASPWDLPNPPVTPGPVATAPGDFDGNGTSDLIWRNPSTGQNVVWLMNGTTFVSQTLLPAVAYPGWHVVAVVDLNADTQPDLVWRNESTGQNVVWFMSGTTFISQTVLPAVADPAWQIVAAGDFNADGKPDLVWRNAWTGQNVVWFLNGATFVLQTALPPVTDTNWQIAAAGDFDSDGKPDLVWRNVMTGLNVVWFMNGTTFVGQVLLPEVTDLAWQLAMTGDFNADGNLDLVWRNYATGQNVVWLMNGTTVVSPAFVPGVGDTNWELLRDRR